jgi:hypothetical protein
MRADLAAATPSIAAIIRLLALVVAAALALPASRLLAAPPPPPTPPVKPLPAYPDITSNFTSKAILSSVMQNFTGTLKRHGRKIYLEEQSTSSGPVGYNEYFIYDLENNMLYRFLRDEQVYFESRLTLDQRVDAIRKGWVPAEGAFTFNNVKATLSSKDIPLRPDVMDKRPVELNLREVTTEVPAIGAVPARTIKYYSFVWLDPALQLPVKISYSVNSTHQIVEYHNIAEEQSDPSLFEIPKDYLNLTPY